MGLGVGVEWTGVECCVCVVWTGSGSGLVG